ncbi:MAG: ABC transporter ATP-binding protein, partial [Anaerolineae bacterium]|nr:ABC transporter ATP-binding protein [Anaerolineae bacterium]
GTGVVLVLSGDGMLRNTFTIGDFSLFVSYLQNISSLTTFFGMLLVRYKQLGVSIDRMQNLMEGASPDALIKPGPVYIKHDPPRISQPHKTPGDVLHTLDAYNLYYHYPGSLHGIENIILNIKKGTLTVITGRIGSGKTTLLRVLLGLLPMDAGEILWNGTRVNQPDKFFLPPRCAYTAQVPNLFSQSLRENILLGLRTDENAVQDAVYRAVLETDIVDLEKGLDTPVGPRGVKLSGGQVQRTAAARMFVRNTELIVFDDLSSALDIETEKMLWDRLFSRETITCLAVSHRHFTLEKADHIVVMKDGTIADQGQLAELLVRSDEMRDIWTSGL